jgi:hypothetical protein
VRRATARWPARAGLDRRARHGDGPRALLLLIIPGGNAGPGAKAPCIGPRPDASAAPAFEGGPPRTRWAPIGYLHAWRAAAGEVDAAGRRWQTVSVGERADVAAALLAALEREETAATAYRLACRA